MIRQPLVVPASMLLMPCPNRDAISAIVDLGQADQVAVSQTLRFVFLCFTNRCGSTYLGEILSSTEAFNPIVEPLNFEEVQPTCSAHNLKSVGEYFDFVARRDARNGVYFLKVAVDHLRLLIDAGILDHIVDRTNFIFLERRDKLDQAISRAIAEQNQQWAWYLDPSIPREALTYSFEQIKSGIDYVVDCNRVFDLFFSLNGIASINVEYERLVAEPQRELDEIASRLRMPDLKLDDNGIGVRRQADDVNRAWRERFLSAWYDTGPREA